MKNYKVVLFYVFLTITTITISLVGLFLFRNLIDYVHNLIYYGDLWGNEWFFKEFFSFYYVEKNFLFLVIGFFILFFPLYVILKKITRKKEYPISFLFFLIGISLGIIPVGAITSDVWCVLSGQSGGWCGM
ncbi:MAG: hypothetical protein EOM23_05460, partial [Candidatus Moranbacteria bacterium]|nr:hypothetical protein [Candidatus Moranbacteria bacterium]